MGWEARLFVGVLIAFAVVFILGMGVALGRWAERRRQQLAVRQGMEEWARMMEEEGDG